MCICLGTSVNTTTLEHVAFQIGLEKVTTNKCAARLLQLGRSLSKTKQCALAERPLPVQRCISGGV